MKTLRDFFVWLFLRVMFNRIISYNKDYFKMVQVERDGRVIPVIPKDKLQDELQKEVVKLEKLNSKLRLQDKGVEIYTEQELHGEAPEHRILRKTRKHP